MGGGPRRIKHERILSINEGITGSRSSLISFTASSLNSRVNFLRSMIHLRFHVDT